MTDKPVPPPAFFRALGYCLTGIVLLGGLVLLFFG